MLFRSKGLLGKTSPALGNLSEIETQEWLQVEKDAAKQRLKILLKHSEDTIKHLNLLIEQEPQLTDTAEAEQLKNHLDKFALDLKEKQQRKLGKCFGTNVHNNLHSTIDTTLAKANTTNKSLELTENNNTNNIVFDLTGTLTDSEQKILQKGVTFCPTNSTLNEFQLHADLSEFARNLRLKEFFADSQSNTDTAALKKRIRLYTTQRT